MQKYLLFTTRFVVVLCLLSGIFSAVQATPPVIAGHPRIFVNSTTKATLLAKKDNNDPDWQSMKAEADNYTTGTVIPWNETSAGEAQYYGTNNIFYSYCGCMCEEA